MTVWQRLNAPRNKREHRVAKIARDQQRERIIELLEEQNDCQNTCYYGDCYCSAIALIKGETK